MAQSHDGTLTCVVSGTVPASHFCIFEYDAASIIQYNSDYYNGGVGGLVVKDAMYQPFKDKKERLQISVAAG